MLKTWKVYKSTKEDPNSILLPIMEASVPAETSDEEIMRISWDWLQANVSKEDREYCHLEIVGDDV